MKMLIFFFFLSLFLYFVAFPSLIFVVYSNTFYHVLNFKERYLYKFYCTSPPQAFVHFEFMYSWGDAVKSEFL